MKNNLHFPSPYHCFSYYLTLSLHTLLHVVSLLHSLLVYHPNINRKISEKSVFIKWGEKRKNICKVFVVCQALSCTL